MHAIVKEFDHKNLPQLKQQDLQKCGFFFLTFKNIDFRMYFH